jgi:Family of unknown function (DUF5906)
LLAITETFDASTPVPWVSAFLRLMVAARLDGLAESQILQAIKHKTGLNLKVLREALKSVQSEIAPPVAPTVSDALGLIRNRYVFVKSINAFWDRSMRDVVRLDAVKNAHWSEMPMDLEDGFPTDPLSILIRGELGVEYVVDKADAMSLVPGAPEIFIEDGTPKLNIWVPPNVPAVPGDITPFADHLLQLFDGDVPAIHWFCDWLAHLVQHPEIKIHSAVLLIGKPGIGKSLIARMLSRLLGEHNTTDIEGSNLLSSFNEWMDGAQLVVVHELMMVDRLEAMERLKLYITDPWIRVNRKNVSTYKYRNRANFLMFSNHKSAARIEKGDPPVFHLDLASRASARRILQLDGRLVRPRRRPSANVLSSQPRPLPLQSQRPAAPDNREGAGHPRQPPSVESYLQEALDARPTFSARPRHRQRCARLP